MLDLPLIHPELLAGLGRSGHGSRVLISDGNYPHATGSPPSATRVFLNLRPGLLTVDQVAEVLFQVIPIESAAVMQPDGDEEPAIFATFTQLLAGLELDRLDRFSFYETARSADVSVVVATGDVRHYANLLLKIGAI